jgi:hypothetical protein
MTIAVAVQTSTAIALAADSRLTRRDLGSDMNTVFGAFKVD